MTRYFCLCLCLCLAVVLMTGCVCERQVAIMPSPMMHVPPSPYQVDGQGWHAATPRPTPAWQSQQPTLAPTRPQAPAPDPVELTPVPAEPWMPAWREEIPAPRPEPQSRLVPVPPRPARSEANPALTPVPPVYLPYSPDAPPPAALPGPELQGPQLQPAEGGQLTPLPPPEPQPRRGIFREKVDQTC